MRANRINSAVLACLLTVGLMLTTGSVGAAQPQNSTRKAGDVWGANYFPNVTLTTHEGKEVRFFDDLIKDKVVVINFIYTKCPDACPMETARLSEIQEILNGRVGEDIFFYSITIDPDYDTPEVLADYRERFQAGPGWVFLTGAEEDIQLLREKLGLYIDEPDKEETDHNINMLMGNQATGHWIKRSPFDNPYMLANQIGTWLNDFDGEGVRTKSYEDAPMDLPDLPRGQSMFNTRCMVCHTIGSLDERRVVGPDLLGVTERREIAWLRRWISEPDKMLEEHDPTAMGLYLAYNKVPMPNLRLSREEVDLIIGFIETESRRMAKVERVEAIAERHDAEVPECCQKDEQAVLNAQASSDPQDSSAATDEGSPAPQRRGRSRTQQSSMVLGGLFGLAAILLRKRRPRA